jgi:FdhD protein
MSNRIQAKRRIWTVDAEGIRRRSDFIAVEEPLEIQLRAGGEQRTIAITMRTPGNDYELAAGFLHGEGVIADKADLERMIYCVDGESERQEYNALAVYLRGDTLPDLPQLDRHFFTNSACGVCGRTMLDDLGERNLPTLSTEISVLPEVLSQMPDALLREQRLFAKTGGLHAAGLFDAAGALFAVREDVGRHNALDKLIGWGLLQRKLPFEDKIVVVSGRASYELLHKCRVAGASILCAVSAPSSLAVDLADRFGITLIAFLRGSTFNIYTHPQRIVHS